MYSKKFQQKTTNQNKFKKLLYGLKNIEAEKDGDVSFTQARFPLKNLHMRSNIRNINREYTVHTT